MEATTVNGIKNSAELSFSKEEVLEALSRVQLSENIRGEALTLEQFAALSDALG